MSSTSTHLILSTSGDGYRFRSAKHVEQFANISSPYGTCKAYAPKARNAPHCSRPINRQRQSRVSNLIDDLCTASIPSPEAHGLLKELSRSVVCGVNPIPGSSWHQIQAAEICEQWMEKLWQEYLRARGVGRVTMPAEFCTRSWEAAAPRRVPVPVSPLIVVARPAAVDLIPIVGQIAVVSAASSLSQGSRPPVARTNASQAAPRRTFTIFADPTIPSASSGTTSPSRPPVTSSRALQSLDVNAPACRSSSRSQSVDKTSSRTSSVPSVVVPSPRSALVESDEKKSEPSVVVICLDSDSSDEECVLTPEASDSEAADSEGDESDGGGDDLDEDENEIESDESEDEADEDGVADEGETVQVNRDCGHEEISDSEDDETEDEADDEDDSEAEIIVSAPASPSQSQFTLPLSSSTFKPLAPMQPHIQLRNLLHSMTQVVSPRRRGAGYIYAFSRPSQPALLKIGYTSASNDRDDPVSCRLLEWERQCGSAAVEVFRVEVPAAVERIESLIHQTLRTQRRVEDCATCTLRQGLGWKAKHHDEWFEIGKLEAEGVVQTWASWAKEKPYDQFGRLTDFWAPTIDRERAGVKKNHTATGWLNRLPGLIWDERAWVLEQIFGGTHLGDEENDRDD